MANNDAVLAELEAQLRTPDSLMEQGVVDVLKEYLRAGGKPQAAIEDLSENFCGVYCCSSVLQGPHAASGLQYIMQQLETYSAIYSALAPCSRP
jgi:hypothetical protein